MKYCVLIISLLLGGCVSYHSPIPKDYSGPITTIDDSFTIQSSRTADMFYIEKINNKNVYNAARASSGASAGKNGLLITRGYTHRLPAAETTLFLSGATMHGAPIGYILNAGSNYGVQGEVIFKPEADKHYLVSGELTQEHSSVWIEDMHGNIVSDVVLLEEDQKESRIVAAKDFEVNTNNIHIPLEAVQQNKFTLFSQISGGESLALVLSKIGEPDSTLYDSGNFFSQRPSHIDYIYDGLGKIRFTTFKKQAQNVLKVMPEISRDPELITTQLNVTGIRLQYIAKEYYKNNQLSEVELDKIADTIWKNRHAEDSKTEDAVAWLMKVIGKQQGHRYYNLISTLTDKSTFSSKITRYAAQVLGQLTPSSISQYQFAIKPLSDNKY
ncbi:hypothetical protein [uncultured Shewanella sp.]|uniref:hypothetical protein n=1 Tax=uncultured Shewanella sp. TaxID=173975 RepID=UPI0026396751|nr:hypothetical protein [uncultured Shewanella sp.]